jgi:hypothetical protein
VPKVEGLAKGTLSGDGTVYRAVVDLRSTTEYRIDLDRSFADIFGQRPVEAHSWSFTTGHARPRLVMETGIFAVEANRDRGAYPVWTRNLSRFDVE